jgi:aryl-alcohol dehydrogenase-like predicted oxidoreductase
LRKGQIALETKDVDKIFEIVEKLKPIAARLDATLAQLALAWCLYNKNVSTVITGASKASQVTENFKAIDVYRKITQEIYEEIEKVLGNTPKRPASFTG